MVAKDEAEEAKLELEHKTKEFESKLATARAFMIEDFKKSDELSAIKGDYALGSYNYAFK